MRRLTTVAAYRVLAIVTTAGVCLLVVAGAFVRLTGSGLGCDDWPRCNAERFIDVSSGHTAIEQVNRLLSGVIGVPTLLLVVVGALAVPRGAGLRWPALGVLATILGNGVVGGLAVRGDLHPALVQSHFLLAMGSIAFGLIAVRRSGDLLAGGSRPRRPDPREPSTALVAVVVAASAAALVTGTVVTGAGPHAGDEDVRRYGLDIGGVARVHSATVIVAVAAAVVLGWLLARRTGRPGTRAALSAWTFTALVQASIGYVQYFTGVPELLVGLHVAGATALWVLTVRLALSTVPAERPAERDEAPITAATGGFARGGSPLV